MTLRRILTPSHFMGRQPKATFSRESLITNSEKIIDTFLANIKPKDLPQELKVLNELRQQVRTSIEQLIPEGPVRDEFLASFEKLYTDIKAHTLKSIFNTLPAGVKAIIELVTLVDSDQPTESQPTKTPRKKTKSQLSAADLRDKYQEHTAFFEQNFPSILKKIGLKNSKVSKKIQTIKALSPEVCLQLMFEPFKVYAENHGCTIEEAMDDKLIRKATATVLAKQLNIDSSSAAAFYAHVSPKFRSKNQSAFQRWNSIN